jgi:rubrerythrin
MLSIKKLKYLIKDEKQAAKFYQKHGLPELAEDERKHRRILTRKLKKRLSN